MTHVLAWLPVLACAAMMFAGGVVAWLAARTPLGRVSWLARRAGPPKPPAPRIDDGTQA